MGRPRKKPGERKDYHLRVPLTDAQRELVEGAAKLGDLDMAAWARSVLLEVAKREIAKSRKGKPELKE